MRKITILAFILLSSSTTALCASYDFALEDRLRQQEQSLDDLRAKVSQLTARQLDSAGPEGGTAGAPGPASGVISIRKQARVTIGGMVETRYFYHNGSLKSSLEPVRGVPNDGPTIEGYQPDYDESPRRKAADYKYGDFKIAEARLRAKIDVNDHFDAYIQVDLQSKANRIANVNGVAQHYWIRWKNICNSGFGVLVGRDDMVFGDRERFGICTGYLGAAFYMNSISGVPLGMYRNNNLAADGRNYSIGEGMFTGWSTVLAHHTGWDQNRTTQITPYWEGLDGKVRIDLSLFQAMDRIDGKTNVAGGYTDADGVRHYKSINYGLGTGSLRIKWKPTPGLQVTASVMNLYQNDAYDGMTNGFEGRWGPWNLGSADRVASSNTAANLSIIYSPACYDRLKLWARWTHGWNEGWVKDMDSDVLNYGISFRLADGLTAFLQGDYLRVKNDHPDVLVWHRANAWAAYAGLTYRLPYGVNFEIGYRHEEATYKDRAGYRHTKAELDTAYAHVGFMF